MPLNERPPETQVDLLTTAPQEEPPVSPALRRTDDPQVVSKLDELIAQCSGESGTFKARMIRDLMQTALKIIPDGSEVGEVKLMTNALKEMRHAYRVFGRYRTPHKVTIFGSARTPETHADYRACVEFSRLMAVEGWMVITGAGMGIMHAGHVGPGRASSFGVAIRLPFEQNTNLVIDGDEKLINFRYFFTRKLMFLSQAEAVVLFPGGFGTMDEAFETLTLVQTGKAAPMPIVMVEGEGGTYWHAWDAWARSQLLERGWICSEDTSLYYIAKDAADAARHVTQFFRNYHSSRYVKDDFVIRLKGTLSDSDLRVLERDFASLIKVGGMRMSGPLEGEDDALELPRLVFHHNRNKFATLRMLIDRINELDAQPPAPPSAAPHA
jgi:uncharacterized protein (TIGR00730 family)